MITVKKMEIEGFRSFKSKTVIEFPNKGAILIKGKNKVAPTASGTGKSSILMALAFVLDYCKLPTTELKNYQSKKMSVKVFLADGINEYIVTRDPKLSLIVNNVPYDGKSAGADEELKKILKDSPDLIETLTYRPQRTLGRFINSTDSEKKEFLSKVLNLNELENAQDKLTVKINNLTTEKTTLESAINALSDQISLLTVTDEAIADANKRYSDAKQNYDNAIKASEGTAELSIKLNQFKDYLQKATNLRYQSQTLTNENKAIESEIPKIKQEIEKLKEAKCPNCLQDWNNYQSALEQKEIKIKTLMQKQLDNINIITENQVKIDNIPVLEQKIQSINLQLGSASAPINNALSLMQAEKNNLDGLTRQKSNYENTVLSINQKAIRLQEVSSLIETYDHASNILGRNGFLGNIFDEVLKEIEHLSNEMITKISNISCFTINLSSTSVTKKGTAKKEISTKIFKMGEEVSVKALSGGQMCGIELCTDLAVSKAIKRRSGSPLGWIALDEAMDGLDAEPKREALEMISNEIGGQVFVIEHNALEISELFQEIVEVEYDGVESYVKPRC